MKHYIHTYNYTGIINKILYNYNKDDQIAIYLKKIIK